MEKEIQFIDKMRANYDKFVIASQKFLAKIPFRILAGRMNTDGIIYPVNDPVLIYKDRIRSTHIATTPVVVMDLVALTGTPPEEMKTLVVEVTPCLVEAGVSIAGDDIEYTMDNGGGTDYIQLVSVIDVGTINATRGRDTLFQLYPDTTHTKIFVGATRWTTGIEYWDHVITVWKMPTSICNA